MSEQLPLFRPRADLSFDNFYVSPSNETVVRALQQWLQQSEGGVFYLHGTEGSGRSHLLQAACRDRNAFYLPLNELREHDPAAIFDGLEGVDLVCLDDIDVALDSMSWCEALFHLFNRVIAAHGKLLVSALQSAANIPCRLQDLQSRLSLGGSFRLHTVDDEDLAPALRLRAGERGIDLSDEVVAYILSRHPRDFGALLLLLTEIDRHSLREQRRITIPFVRRFLGA
jgi:DnaA-homolog protein